MWQVSLGPRQAGALKEEMLKLRFKAEGEARKLSCMLRQLQMGGQLRPGPKRQGQGSKMAGIGLLKLLFPFLVPVSSRPSPFFLPFSPPAIIFSSTHHRLWDLLCLETQRSLILSSLLKKMYFYLFWDSISLYIPGQPGAYYIDQAVLHFTEICLPVPESVGTNCVGFIACPHHAKALFTLNNGLRHIGKRFLHAKDGKICRG